MVFWIWSNFILVRKNTVGITGICEKGPSTTSTQNICSIAQSEQVQTIVADYLSKTLPPPRIKDAVASILELKTLLTEPLQVEKTVELSNQALEHLNYPPSLPSVIIVGPSVIKERVQTLAKTLNYNFVEYSS